MANRLKLAEAEAAAALESTAASSSPWAPPSAAPSNSVSASLSSVGTGAGADSAGVSRVSLNRVGTARAVGDLRSHHAVPFTGDRHSLEFFLFRIA